MSTVCESATNPCVDREREQRGGERDLEALMGSSLTGSLAKGTKEAVKVKLGLQPRVLLAINGDASTGRQQSHNACRVIQRDCESLQSSICFHTVKKVRGVRTQEQISVSFAKSQTCTGKEF